MKVASVTLTNSANDSVLDALKTVVDWVDGCIMINTSGKPQEYIKEKEIVGDKLLIVDYEVISAMEQTAHARNFGLKAAYDLGFDWACILDTDERMLLNGEDIRKTLETTTAETFLVNHIDNSYTKDRFFRLPAKAVFIGATHEVYEGFKTIRFELEKVKFSELPKTAEQQLQKSIMVRDALLRDLVRNKNNARSWYYLADAYKSLGERQKAIDAFIKCGQINTWDEESAFAYFRAAECYSEINDYDKVIQCCMKGIAIHPGLPELPWLIAFANFQLKHYRNAMCWAHMALGTGKFIGCGRFIEKQGFRYEPGAWEKPYDILRFSYKALGLEQESVKYEIKFLQSEQMRMQGK